MTLLLKGKHYFLKGKYFLQVAVLQILVFIEKCLFILNLCVLAQGSASLASALTRLVIWTLSLFQH